MPLGSILGQSGVGDIFFHLFKIPFIIIMIIITLFHLNYKVRMPFISQLFIFFGVLSLIHGVFTNPISKVTATHLYGAVMPILAISFGSYFIEHANIKTIKLLYRMLKYSFYLLSMLIVVYFLLYLNGNIIYFGMATKVPYFTAYFLSVGSNIGFSASVVITLMTGKRAMISAILAQILFIYFHLNEWKYLSILKRRLVLVLLIVVLVLIALATNTLSRFQPFLNLDLFDKHAMYLATSGRSSEIFGILEYFSREEFSWFYGGGFGETYSYISEFSKGSVEVTQHYSHFSPFYYILVYGSIFTTLLYAAILKIFLKSLLMPSNLFSLIAIGMFAVSFLGASMLVDPQLWFFIGALIHICKYPVQYDKFSLAIRR